MASAIIKLRPLSSYQDHHMLPTRRFCRRRYKSSKGNGYFQVNAAAPIAMVGFSMTCSRGPAYAIKYSDDKTNWYTTNCQGQY